MRCLRQYWGAGMSVVVQRLQVTEPFPVPEIFAIGIAEIIYGEHTTTVVFHGEDARATGRVTFPKVCWEKLMADKAAGLCSEYGPTH